MPDPIPAAPASDTPPPVAAPAAPAAPTAESENKKLSSQLFKLLTTPSEDVTEPKKETTKPAAPEKPTSVAPVVEKPIKVKTKTAPVEQPPKIPSKADLVPAAPPSPATPAPARAAEPELNEADLVEEERALLDDARAAEKHLPEKYKGQAGKMTAFLRENAKQSDLVDKGELDQEDYEKWYRENAPRISNLDLRQIERNRIKEDVSREMEPKIENERHARWVESETPKLAAKGDETKRDLLRLSYPDEVLKAAEDRLKGVTDPKEHAKIIGEVRKDYALEVETTERVVDAAREDIQELRRLTTQNPTTKKSLIELDPEAQVWDGAKWIVNPAPRTERGIQHARLLNLVNNVCDEFKTTGGAALRKDGKWFVTKAEWADMAPTQRAPFWTFSIDDIIGRALGNVKHHVKAAVQQQHRDLEARGFRRTIAAPAVAAPAAPAAPGAPPAPRAAPAPGPGTGGGVTVGSRLAAQLLTTPSEG